MTTEGGATGVDRATFLEIMSAFASGVAVVTTVDADGTPRGLSTSAFCSVSADPPLVLVCVDRTSRTLEPILQARMFVVNILGEERAELCRHFATKLEDKFGCLAWEPAGRGLPYLSEDAVAYAVCETEQVIEAGDHVVIIGRVVDGRPPAGDARPLLFFRRSFGRFAPD